MRKIARHALVAASLSAATFAQTTPSPSQGIDRAAIEGLVSTLQDDAQRAVLVAQLRGLLTVAPTPPVTRAPSVVETVTATLAGLSGRVQEALLLVVEQAGSLPQRLRTLGAVLADPPARDRLLGQLTWFAIALLAAFAAAIGARLLLARPRAAIARASDSGPLARSGWITARALLLLAPSLAALAGGLATATFFLHESVTRACVVATLTAVVIRRLCTVVLTAALAPDLPALRALPLGDESARAVAGHLHLLANLAVYGWLGVTLTHILANDPGLPRAMAEVYAMTLLVGVVGVILANRGRARAFLQTRRSDDQGGMRGLLWATLSLWWSLAIAYGIAIYLVWSHDLGGGSGFLTRASLWSLAVVIAAATALGLTRAGVQRAAAKAERITARIPEVAAHMQLYGKVVQVALDVIVVGLGVCLLLEAWGVASLDALRSDAWTRAFAALFDVLVVFVLAVATIDFATVVTQRFIDSRVRAGAATAKVRTLVPLARTAIKVVVATAAALMILTALGVDIGPLLAGVGIIGLALGFGAQTLVKDIITGVFILLEDTLAVGDTCVLAGASGVVESIGLRSVRLRDVRGVVHTVPFSSVDRVANMTKDFSYCLIEAGVSYSTDVEKVMQVLRALGDELRQDPVFGVEILEPLEIHGLDRFDESAVVVRARFKTRPGAQWRVGREFNRRLKTAFDAHGIEIPFPHRTLILRREGGEAGKGD